MTDQHGHGRFGSVALVGEHRLAEKTFSERDAVNSADQISFEPAFNGMSVPKLVKPDVGPLHLPGDPSPVLISARNRGARVNDRSEGSIESNLEAALPENPPQPPRDVKIAGFEDEPWVGRPPENRQPLSIPGKNSQLISKQQPLVR